MYPQGTGPPQQWSPQPPLASQPPATNGAYPVPPPGQQPQQRPPPPTAGQHPPLPPSSQYPPPPHHHPGAMQALHPQHPDQYRLPAPHQMYPGPPPPHDPRYPPPPHMAYPAHQPAPRQRTAIACRYCRRRKIRCSGFENSEDGRCTNCARFSQECIFTPVSAQTQAFVPAHTVWRGNGQAPPLYGAYGQPLPPGQHQQAYQPHPPRQPDGSVPPPPGYPLPSPNSTTNGSPYHQTSPYPAAGQKRPATDPHTPTLPPPNPATHATLPTTAAPSGAGPPQYQYPDPQQVAGSPASSAASYQTAQPPPGSGAPQASPYYTTAAQAVSNAQQQAHRSPAQPAAPAPEPSRTSHSPQNRAHASTPGGKEGAYPAPPTTTGPPAAAAPVAPHTPDSQALRAGSALPIRNDDRKTPQPGSAGTPQPHRATPARDSPNQHSQRSTSADHTNGAGRGMNISDLVSGQGSRPTTDSDMPRK